MSFAVLCTFDFDPNFSLKLSFMQTIQNCARYPMCNNAVMTSLSHNENLFVPHELKAEIGACAADYVGQFERYIELARCQDNVLETIELASYLQACGSFMPDCKTREATLKSKYCALAKYPRTQLGFFYRRWCNGKPARSKRC